LTVHCGASQQLPAKGHPARPAGSTPPRLGNRGINIHSLRKTAIHDAIRNGATRHAVRGFAGHSDLRTTELDWIRKEEDAEVAARCTRIRVARAQTTRTCAHRRSVRWRHPTTPRRRDRSSADFRR
jgi:hypothetical protein